MKKLLTSATIAALALILSATAFAATENFDFGASLEARVNFISPDNAPDTNFFESEVYLWATADLADNVMAKINLRYRDNWGDGEPIGDINSGGDIEAWEAYIKLAQIWETPISAKIGRFANEKVLEGSTHAVPYYGEGFIIPNNRPSDGITLSWDIDPSCLDIMHWKLVEGGVASEDDATLYGIYFYTKAVENHSIDAYLAYVNNNTADNETVVVGARIEGGVSSVEGLSYKAELAYTDTDPSAGTSVSGMGGYIGAAYAFEGEGGPSVRANLYYLDDEFIQPLGHVDQDDLGESAYGRIADLGSNLVSNVWFVNVGGTINPSDKASVDADFFWYQAPEDVVPGQDSIGIELDLRLSYQYSENVAAELIGAYFAPDDDGAAAAATGFGDDTFLVKGGVKVSF
jgi:hypothetical protein